jgi:hypothetical protein
MTSERFVSGGAGRFTFDVANGLLDDVERLKGKARDGEKKQSKPPGAIIARLREKITSAQAGFDAVDNWEDQYEGDYGVEFFRWTAVEIDKGTTSHPYGDRYVKTIGDHIPNVGINSQMFGAPPSGIALKLSGYANVNDLVSLYPFPTYGKVSHERFFAFYGPSDPIASGTVGVLKIIDSAEIGGNRWVYSVEPRRYRNVGSVPSPESLGVPVGLAYNLYEQSSLYGQPLSGSNGRLEVVGPIPQGSVVLGTYQTRLSFGYEFYVFQAPLPLRAVCDGPGMAMMQEQGDARLMRDGL